MKYSEFIKKCAECDHTDHQEEVTALQERITDADTLKELLEVERAVDKCEDEFIINSREWKDLFYLIHRKRHWVRTGAI